MVDNTAYIYGRLVKGGVSPIGAMGLLGNWKAESGTGISPTAQNPGGAYGIAQWNDRKPALFAYAKAQGQSPSNLDTQIDFALHELNGPENKTLQGLNAATDIRSATRAAVGYERPEGWKANNPEAAYDFGRRLSYAQGTQGLLGSPDTGSSYASSSAAPVPNSTISTVAPPQPAVSASAAPDPSAAGPAVGLLGAAASGGIAPPPTDKQQGFNQIQQALSKPVQFDPVQQAPDPGLQRLMQQKQMAMQAAQKYLPPPPGMTGLLG